jgi:hypothetical protein
LYYLDIRGTYRASGATAFAPTIHLYVYRRSQIIDAHDVDLRLSGPDASGSGTFRVHEWLWQPASWYRLCKSKTKPATVPYRWRMSMDVPGGSTSLRIERPYPIAVGC